MNTPVIEENQDKTSPSLVDEIIKMSEYSFERMPMLQIIGERLADLLSDVVSEISGMTADVTLAQQDYIAMWQVLEGLPKPGFFVDCVGNSPSDLFFLAMDNALVLTNMELMLGGNPTNTEPTTERAPTAIERRFSQRLAEVVLVEMQAAFGIAVDMEFDLAGTEVEIEPTMVTQPANLCVRLQFNFVQAAQIGNLQIVLPYEMLEPMRKKLNKIHYGMRTDQSNQLWQESLEKQIERTTVEIEAELTQVQIPLREIMSWNVEDTFSLWVQEDHDATVIFNGKKTFSASVGKRQTGNAALKIKNDLTTE